MEICESILCEERIFTMGKNKEKSKKIKSEIVYPIVIAVGTELILSLVIFLAGKISGFLSLPDMVKSIDERVCKLESTQNGEAADENTEKSTTTIETNKDGTAVITITGKSNVPVEIEEGSGELDYRMSSPSCILNDSSDQETGEKYTFDQLVNKKVLISFENGNYENYFYGQFNENDHWDGECITNIYEDDKLFFIMEAKYDDGNLLSYKQALKSKTDAQKEVWSLAERECVIDQEIKTRYNTGETWNYYYIDYTKQFEIDDAKPTNIKYVDNFRKELQEFSSLEGYYHGNTYNGLYSDSTGDAYMLKYSEDGIIRGLYVGVFKNGFLDDASKNAWEIVFDRSNNINKYFYYKGVFKNGVRKGDVGSEDYITQEDIDKYTQGMTFNNCKMNWYGLNE